MRGAKNKNIQIIIILIIVFSIIIGIITGIVLSEKKSKNTINYNFYYSINKDKISVVSKYNSENDLLIELAKKGGNNIFDFYNLGLIHNTSKKITKNLSSSTSFNLTTSDWHSPFIVKAINNIDGDSTNEFDFTGGNHEYTNTGTGGTPTARTTNLKFFIDNIEHKKGAGYGSKLEIRWTNLVQGNNTKKEDGTGREILQENHILIFDGYKWNSYVELIPLEDIFVKTWYGFQICASNDDVYPKVRYIGGTNKEEYDLSSPSYSGGKKATKIIRYGDTHKIELEIDPSFDLGNMKYISDRDSIFTLTYGKSYFNIIENQKLIANNLYALRGSYKFVSL